MNIKEFDIPKLNDLSQQIRERIIDVVSKNGGHLSSTIGATELIVAMHYVFNAESDPFIFDVSHQAYAHKLLTNRWDEFESLRQFGGISGFTKPSESSADYFVAGHSSTSISLAVGAAKAIRLSGQKRIPVALIGDGSMSAGMVWEALNELGDKKYPVVIILNDNEMSIAKPIGALSNYLSQIFATQTYQKIKSSINAHIRQDSGAKYILKKLDESLRMITPGIIFEELGIEYIGPVDGHDIKAIIDTLEKAKRLEKPVIVHAQTLKGKGYEIAEGKFEHWHGVGPFDIETGKASKKSSKPSPTDIFAKVLLELAHNNPKVVGFTAAMPSGTGMDKLISAYPERFFDVAIAEQHAITSAAAMAKEGFVPFVAIYSTFLQRGFDQIIHDVAIMDLPVIFAIDRAGIVGEDGETHQGVFDVSFFNLIPNFIIFAPRDEASLVDAIGFASRQTHPVAFRYPRGSFVLEESINPAAQFELGKSELLIEGDGDVLLIGYGNGVGKAIHLARRLEISVGVLDLRFVKPLDTKTLNELSKKYKKWFIISDSAMVGGVGSILALFLQQHKIYDVAIKSFEYEDSFITHGNKALVEKSLGLDEESIFDFISTKKGEL